MRTTIATIHLVLRTNKRLSTGLYPIMLRCNWKSMKEVSTGYSCSIKDWDKRNECCKKSFPNFVMVNQELMKLKNAAIKKRDSFVASGEVYTPAMILSKEEVRDINTNDLDCLIERYIQEKGLEGRTIEKWRIIKRNLKRFSGRDILVNEINESYCRRYCKWLEGNGLSSGSIRSYMSKVVAILHYAHNNGLIDSYPLSGWKYHKEYRECKSELYIHSRSMEVMIDIFLDRVINMDGDRWSYKTGVIEELLDIHSSLYALYLYLIIYRLCGISPVDISVYMKKDIKIRDIKGKSYYYFNGNRSKTGIEYRFYLPVDDILNSVLIRTMLMFNDGEYFLPTLKGYVGKDIRKRINNVYSYHSEHLLDWFRLVNAEIIKRNVENGDNIELVDLDCRYYSARHSYIMAQIQSPNVNLLKIATVTGKSVTSIHQYLTLLGETDLIG